MPRLSIITCAYNERSTILAVLDRIHAVDLGKWEKEMIVVDNCSTDGTRELLQQVKWPEARVIFHPRNLGKGASIRTGFAQARGDYAVIQDADFEYDPEELPLLLKTVDETGAEAVFGSRTLGGRAIYKYARMYWGIRFFTAVTNLLYGGHLTDVGTGTKLVRTDIVRQLKLVGSGFELDFELPCRLLKNGYRIVDVSVSYHPRTFAEGKKIKVIRDGLRTLWTILRVRLA
jgi:dolichol-phosphate mannosyltransferase